MTMGQLEHYCLFRLNATQKHFAVHFFICCTMFYKSFLVAREAGHTIQLAQMFENCSCLPVARGTRFSTAEMAISTTKQFTTMSGIGVVPPAAS